MGDEMPGSSYKTGWYYQPTKENGRNLWCDQRPDNIDPIVADVSPGAVPDLVTLVFKPVGYLHYFHLKRETNDPLFGRQMLPTHGVNKPCGRLDVGRVSFVHHGPLAAFECGCHGQRQLLLSHNCAVIGGTWYRVRGQG